MKHLNKLKSDEWYESEKITQKEFNYTINLLIDAIVELQNEIFWLKAHVNLDDE